MDEKKLKTINILDCLDQVLSKYFSQKPQQRHHYCIGDYQEESYCLEYFEKDWIVYSGERGNKYHVVRCDNVFDACKLLIRKSVLKQDREKLENEFITLIRNRV